MVEKSPNDLLSKSPDELMKELELEEDDINNKNDTLHYFIKKKVKAYARKKSFILSVHVLEGNDLDRIITDALDRAMIRASNNGRKSIMPYDL